MKKTYVSLFFLMSICTIKSENIAEQWAEFTAQQQQKTRRHNRLHDDVEQQEERNEFFFARMLQQKEAIASKIDQCNDEQLHQLGQACYALTASFLKEYEESHPDAARQLHDCLQLFARIKLLQDPFFAQVLHIVDNQLHPTVSTCSIEQLEDALPIDRTDKERLMHYLIEVALDADAVFNQADDVSIQKLHDILSAGIDEKKMLASLTGLLIMRMPGDGDISSEAKELYMAAVMTEGATDKLINKKSKKDIYPLLEGSYGSAVMLYLKAHDAGHPFAIKDAKNIMNGPLSAIVDWKSRRGDDKTNLKLWTEIWREINRREYNL